MYRCLVVIIILVSALPALSQDHTLGFYLDQALHNSPLLKDYQAQVAAAAFDSAIIRAGYGLQVTGSSVNTYAPVIRGYGYDNAISNGGNFSTLVGAGKTFISKKNLDTRFETLRLQNQGLNNTAKISEQDLKRNVTSQYITTFGDWQQLTFNRETFALLQKEDTLLKDLTE